MCLSFFFLLNFNSGYIPKSVKDEDYINDFIKDEVCLYKTVSINKKIKEYTINKINSIKNLVITYKLKDYKKEYYPSPLIENMHLNIVKKDINIKESYSKINDLINYAKELDSLRIYGSITNNYYIYKNTYNNISYNSYDNSFKNINIESLKEYLNGKLTLSYSSLNNYHKCSFRYFLANILKLDKYEEKFEAFIGSLFHDVLEKCFNNTLDVQEEVNAYIKSSNKILNSKEEFFVNKIIDDIKFVINSLNTQKSYISLDKALYEKNIVIDKSKDFKVEFVGFVDKILYKELNDQTLVAVIDYKTGYIDTSLNYVPYGINLQLPIYLYLIKKSNLFKNPIFVGFYLQFILSQDILRKPNITYLEQKLNNLKLNGYSNANIHNLSYFDKTLENSQLIKGMSLKKDGNFKEHAKVLNDREIEKLIEITENKIDKSIDNILNGQFNINPKKIGFEKNIGCEFCKFKDICYKKEQDYEILDEIDSLKFLGGDIDA